MLAVLVLSIGTSAIVKAAPGIVLARVGTVRARPLPSAAVLAVLSTNQAIWISADPVRPGWREARLGDGRVGYILEAEVGEAVAPSAPPTPTVAQQEPPVWLAGGMGGALVGSAGGIGMRAEIAAGFGRGIVTVGYMFATEAATCAPFACAIATPQSSNKELSARFGSQLRRGGFGAAISAGPAAIWTVQRGSTLVAQPGLLGGNYQYNRIDRFTVGATVEGGIALSSRVISIGPTVHATVDPVQQSVALVLDLRVGYLGEP
jgi:hypothetical protein